MLTSVDSTKLTVSRLSTSTGRNSSGRPPEQCSHGRNRVNTTSGGDGIPLPSKKQFTGEIDLTHLPDGMKRLYLQVNEFSGEIDLTHLPDRMKRLFLQVNEFSGEVDLTHLLDKMEYLSLNTNRFSGEIDLTQLPQGMQYLYLQDNQFTREIDLTHLLSEMLRLFLDNNRFSGEVHFTYFPYNMTQLNLENNKLSGSLVIQAPTKRMCINVKGNQFNAIAVLHSKVHATIHLSGSGMTSVVDEMVHVIANGS